MKNLNSAITTLSSFISNENEVKGSEIVEAYNNLAKELGIKTVSKFTSKPNGAQRLEELIEHAEKLGSKVETKAKETKAKETKAKETKAKETKAKETKAKAPRKVGLVISIDEQKPRKMSDIKISEFKNAETIVLNKEPSAPQLKHLKNMGVDGKVSYDSGIVENLA